MKVTLIAVVAFATIAWASADDAECVFRKKSGLELRWPNPENCGRFYRCSRGIKREIICPNDREYDDVSGKCVAAGTGTCMRSNSIGLFAATLTDTENDEVCKTAEDGSFVARPGFCRDFYICNANIGYLQNCDSGSYFNDTKNNCQPDTTTSCWQNSCIQQADGYIFADASDCTQYFSCSNKEVVQESCDTGSYFDAETKTCAVDTNNDKCWLNACVNKPDGTLVPDSCNENNYFECSANKVVKKSCGDGIFDATQLMCVAKCTTESATGTSTTVSTTTTAPPTTTPCTSESTTSVCTSETTTPCTSETTTSVCTAETTTPCKTGTEAGDCPGGYKTGDFVADPDNCMKFLICSEGKLYEYSCGAGNYFNADSKICDLDTTGKCPQCTASASPKTRSVTADDGCGCPGGYKNGDFVPSDDCSKFYICENGTLFEESCQYGNLFDSCNKVCVPDTNHTCWDYNACENQADNTFVADPKNCNQYYKCVNETGTSLTCDAGDYFNATLGYCVPDTELICSNPCASTSGIVFLPYPLNCTKFYFCNAGKSLIEQCSSGFFDVERGLCLDNALCSTNACEGKVDGTTFPIANSTKDFTVCLNHVATNRTCPSDRVFNATRGICLEMPSPNCDQSNCATMTPNEGFATLDNSPDNFCLCNNGDAYEYQCATNYTFNAKLGICYSNASCDPEFCLTAPEYQVAINRNDIHSFCMCVSNVSVIVDCPKNGIFNPLINTDGECVPNIVADPECNAMDCLNAKEYSIFPATTNEGFCVCKANTSSFRYCPDNYLFNKTLEICLPECEVEQCYNNAPGYTFADAASSSSYCYCYNATYVTKFDCPTNTLYNADRGVCLRELCDSSVCLNQTIANSPFPAVDNTAAFCLCNGTKAKFYNCTAGSVFNGQVCIPEVFLNCNISLCANATAQSPYPTPAINNSAAFCYCFAPDTVRLFDCPVGTLYDTQKEICVAPSSASSCTCPGGYKEGQFLANPSDCSKYYICSSGRLQEGDCGTGNYFDDSCNLCKPDTNNTCNTTPKPCTCVGGYTEGQMIANPNSCQLFYICSGGKLQEMDCGPNNTFNAKDSVCVPKSATRISRSIALADYNANDNANANANDNDDFSCQNKEKRSVPSNCTLYETCVNGIWRRRQCTALRYYNPEKKICLEPRDDTVCMWAKVSGLPVCNNNSELLTHVAKYNNCAQYYQCRTGQWHLYQCTKHHYFIPHLNTCISGVNADVCVSTPETALSVVGSDCQDMRITGFPANCAMYLMCLNQRWWYQYCPLGMYFNDTENYCMPDTHSRCASVRQLMAFTATTPLMTLMNSTFMFMNCTNVGEVHVMSDDCHSYYNCTGSGKWRVTHCPTGHYFDNTTKTCQLDDKGECVRCTDMEQHAYPLNCTAYVKCQNGHWQRDNCPANEVYDNVLHNCIAADQSMCAHGGLRPACQHGETRSLPDHLPSNLKLSRCTHFYYCHEQHWLLATCLSAEYFYSNANGTCMPLNFGSEYEKCKEQHNTALNVTSGNSVFIDDTSMNVPCAFSAPNVAVPDESDCTRYYVCAAAGPLLLQCPHGTYFEAEHAFCRPNNGECRARMTGVCATANNGQLLPDAHNCTLYYVCSLHNGTQLHSCNEHNRSYFNALTQQCDQNSSVCHLQLWHMCTNVTHATNLAHDKYCNVYYTCLHDVAYLARCANGQVFSVQEGKCIVIANSTSCEMASEEHFSNQIMMTFNVNSCQHATNGTYLADYTNCTRYFICYAGEAVARHCAMGAYFNRLLGLCELDTQHVCPHVQGTALIEEQATAIATMAEGLNCSLSHGAMSQDASNCNDFYVCLSGKWRHERCHAQHYFNTKLMQCQAFVASTEIGTDSIGNSNQSSMAQCADMPRNNSQLCQLSTDSLAYPGDCRCYISCGGDMPPTMNRCRNGESYDSLLGFCRQNDGTCLLENGQRVGECNGRHGELVRNAENCRAYYVCINGQKIEGICAENEYFSRSDNRCLADIDNIFGGTNQTESTTQRINYDLCYGLNESVLYPYVKNDCHSYFQCIDGVPNVQLCADNLYFDYETKRCIKAISKCIMPNTTSQLTLAFTLPLSATALPLIDVHQRAPPATQQNKLCVNAVEERPYADKLNSCKSYYICHTNGSISQSHCLENERFDEKLGECFNATLVDCK